MSTPAGAAPAAEPGTTRSGAAPGRYVVAGICFGFLLTKAEVISWFRIQEMFRFDGFHMYGIFATAMPVAILTVQLIKRRRVRTIDGEPITILPKTLGRGTRYIAGGTLFGFGWALVGACPGPLFALLGSGIGVIGVVIVAAIAGTWVYGWARPRLPH